MSGIVAEKQKRARPDEITGIRKLINDRSKEVGVNMADLSRAMGRNSAYVQQYIKKGTPRRLGENERLIVATLLDLDESLLRDSPLPSFLPRPQADYQPTFPAGPSTATGPTQVPRQVPLFRESEKIDYAAARQWAPALYAVGPPCAAAIWIENPQPRLRPGEVCYARTEQPTRCGDVVALLAKNGFATVGELTDITVQTVSISTVGEPIAYQRDEVTVMKIVAIVLP